MKTIILIAMLFAIAQSQMISPGKYRITCAGSGDGATNVLDVENEYTNAGNPIIVYKWHDGTNQHFNVEYVDGLWATLTAENSGKTITVASNSDGAFYTQEITTGAWNQQFKFGFTLDGLFTITNRGSGKVITCPDNFKTNGGNYAAVQGGKYCNKNEKWDFEPLDVAVPTR